MATNDGWYGDLLRLAIEGDVQTLNDVVERELSPVQMLDIAKAAWLLVKTLNACRAKISSKARDNDSTQR